MSRPTGTRPAGAFARFPRGADLGRGTHILVSINAVTTARLLAGGRVCRGGVVLSARFAFVRYGSFFPLRGGRLAPLGARRLIRGGVIGLQPTKSLAKLVEQLSRRPRPTVAERLINAS